MFAGWDAVCPAACHLALLSTVPAASHHGRRGFSSVQPVLGGRFMFKFLPTLGGQNAELLARFRKLV